MKKSKLEKDTKLGMKFGTANNRLKKEIMFALVVECNKNICFKCGSLIENSAEFSIEHKRAWLRADNPKETFFDLNNIAFSHLKCNRQESNGGEKLRKIGPEGTAWCTRHKDFLPVERFPPRKRNWNGLDIYCRECRNFEKVKRDKRKMVR